MQSADKPGQRQLLLTSGPPAKTGPRAAFVTVDPPLGKYAAQAFADVLSVEWGLARLALQDGVLDQDEVSTLKSIHLWVLLILGIRTRVSSRYYTPYWSLEPCRSLACPETESCGHRAGEWWRRISKR